MKTFKIPGILLLSIILIFLHACEKIHEDKTSKVEFAVYVSQGQLKSVSEALIDSSNNYFAWHLLISVADENGQSVFEDEIISLLAFGDGFVTGKIEMKIGEYQLTKFMVINPEGSVIFASPMEGSPKSRLVDSPLPLTFRIIPGEVNRVMPQVLPTENSEPYDFGYVSFGFQVIRPIVAYVMTINDNLLYYRPTMIIPAHMTLFTSEGRVFDYELLPEVNKILIKPGYEYYHVIVENPNYPPLEMDVHVSLFTNTSPDDPLIFRIGEYPGEILELQPGPEEGKDAMITDLDPEKNFGDHPYFEASFITEPILTVMRTKRSLIRFDLGNLPKSARIEQVILQLQFEQPVWDSLYQAGLDEFMLWDDRLVLQQITEPWEEHSVTWNNQPRSIVTNQVFIPVYTDQSSNIRSYDVTSLFVPIQEIAAPNHGIMFRHPETDNPMPGGLQFASSDHPVKEMRPKLMVKYSIYSDY